MVSELTPVYLFDGNITTLLCFLKNWYYSFLCRNSLGTGSVFLKIGGKFPSQNLKTLIFSPEIVFDFSGTSY